MIYVTGDTHGNFSRFSMRRFPEQRTLTKDDVVIILGDFGGIWDAGGPTKDEDHWLDWLNEKNFTTLFLDGNHENFDRLSSDFPETTWKGGRVHLIRPSVIHLMRGEIYEIDGTTFFTFGGGKSHDTEDGILERDDPRIRSWRKQGRRFRVNHLTWWEAEMPSLEEMAHARARLECYGNEVDYILTHAPSAAMLAKMGRADADDELAAFFDTIQKKVTYRHWFCGHMHEGAYSQSLRTQVLGGSEIFAIDELAAAGVGADLDFG